MHRLKYNIFFYISLALILIYPVQFSANYLNISYKVADLSSAFLGKKGIESPHFYIQDGEDTIEFKSDQAIEEDDNTYAFTSVIGTFDDANGKYNLVADTAYYHPDRNHIDFVKGFTINRADGQITGRNGLYKINDNIFAASGGVTFEDPNKYVMADEATMLIATKVYDFHGNVRARIQNDLDDNLITAERIEIFDLEELIVLEGGVSIKNKTVLLTGDEFKIKYQRNQGHDLLISSVEGDGHVSYLNSELKSHVQGDHIFVEYEMLGNSKSVLKQIIVDGDVDYASKQRQESLTGDYVNINYKNGLIYNSIAEGKVEYHSSVNSESMDFFCEKIELNYKHVAKKASIKGGNSLAMDVVRSDKSKQKQSTGSHQEEVSGDKIDRKVVQDKTIEGHDSKSRRMEGSLRGNQFVVDLVQDLQGDGFLVQNVFGEGRIVYESSVETIRSEFMSYDRGAEYFKLSKNVEVERKEGVFKGDVFTYNFKTGEGELSSNKEHGNVNVEINQEEKK